MPTVTYTRMADMTKADAALVEQDFHNLMRDYPERLLAAVEGLGSRPDSMKVTRTEHSLQCATRALQDGRSDEYVVAALLHDIGDDLAPYSHGQMVAAILKPFVGERICWMIEKHALFQTYYYAHLIGLDRNGRDKYRDHPYYQDCVDFCEQYDQASFDPEFKSLPLEYFDPIVRRVFGTNPDLSGSVEA